MFDLISYLYYKSNKELHAMYAIYNALKYQIVFEKINFYKLIFIFYQFNKIHCFIIIY